MTSFTRDCLRINWKLMLFWPKKEISAVAEVVDIGELGFDWL